MCGRFNNHLPKMHGWADALQEWPSNIPSYNVPPTTGIAAFIEPKGQVMRWGLVPSWSDTFSSSYTTFNARIEGIDTKPTYRSAWRNARRCLIPMAGYYEWRGEKGNKQPFYITDRDIGGIVTAGLYEVWGDDQYSCTIITKPANDMMSQLHHRMPVMLSPESAHEWLEQDNDTAMDLLHESEVDSLIYYPVSKAVGNVKNKGEELIVPIDGQ